MTDGDDIESATFALSNEPTRAILKMRLSFEVSQDQECVCALPMAEQWRPQSPIVSLSTMPFCEHQRLQSQLQVAPASLLWFMLISDA